MLSISRPCFVTLAIFRRIDSVGYKSVHWVKSLLQSTSDAVEGVVGAKWLETLFNIEDKSSSSSGPSGARDADVRGVMIHGVSVRCSV